ncbi:Probable NADH oxidase [Weissella viridescens]|uniref:Probable NADH oxidase n=1 Tax=Weissella viridescens TaxID=1629 RepID=A0A380NYX0_WEIVI|nr:Probable NADH oxidase [Weissella viridescens]
MSKSWDDANRLKAQTEDVKRAIVIGAGYIGAELAEQLSLAGKQITLIDALDRVLAKMYHQSCLKSLHANMKNMV